MAVLALALYAAFLLIAGGMRAFIQYRRTGDFGARHGRPGTAQWWGSIAPGLSSLLTGISPGRRAHRPDAPSTAQLAMGSSWRIGM